MQNFKKEGTVSLEGDNKELKKDTFLVPYFLFARHAEGGANGSLWWGWLGVVLCFEKCKKNVLFLRKNSTEQ